MNEAFRCSATSNSGDRCKKASIRGGMVCWKHGGAAPQVKAKAAERLIIAAVMGDMAQAAKDPERVLAEVGCIAYSRPSDIYGEDGTMIQPGKLPPHVAASVASVEQEKLTGNVDKGDGKFDRVLKQKVRLWDKPKMLELLAKHLKLVSDHHEVTITVNLDEKIKAARNRQLRLTNGDGA